MRTPLGISILATSLLVTPIARADGPQDVFVILTTSLEGSKACPADAGWEVTQLFEDPDGGSPTAPAGAYEVPVGYVLEITDVIVTVKRLDKTTNKYLAVRVQNRADANRRHTAFSVSLAAEAILSRTQLEGLDDPARAGQYILPRGTQHFGLGTGFLVSPRARLCVATDMTPQERSVVRLRGRLHKVADLGTPPDPVPPQPIPKPVPKPAPAKKNLPSP